MKKSAKPVPRPKKPYSTPHLVVYGSLEQITKTVGSLGPFDNASKLNKTHFRVRREPELW